MTTRRSAQSPGRESILRPEVRPLTELQLSASQHAVARNLVFALDQAVSNLDRHMSESRMRASRSNSRLGSIAHHSDGNQLVLLSGERGTGKTSLWRSIEAGLRNKTLLHKLLQERESRGDSYASTVAAEEHAEERLPSRVLCLDMLELELLPGPTNLLTSILTRIDRLITQHSHRSSSFNAENEYEQVLIRFDRLMTDVSLAWDGNLTERRQHLDPDLFAVEERRVERGRLNLSDRLSDVLDDLSGRITWEGGVRDPLFVLPVDDFDLSPTRCLELLRMIRMLQIPRLFTVILGDLKNTLDILQLRFTGDIASVAGIQLDGQALESPFHHAQREMTHDAVRKLLPPAQRFFVSNLTCEEVLRFRPTPDGPPLFQILRSLRINIAPPLVEDAAQTQGARFGSQDRAMRFTNVLEFMTRSPITPSDASASESESNNRDDDQFDTPSDEDSGFEPNELSSYSAVRLLKAPARVVMDMWHMLSRTLGAQSVQRRWESESMAAYAPFVSLLQDLVRSEAGMDADRVASIIYRIDHPSSFFRIRSGLLKVRARHVIREKDLTCGEAGFRFRTGLRWWINTVDADGVLGQQLTPLCSAIFILSHDLIVRDREHRIPVVSLAPPPGEFDFAATTWKREHREVAVPWLAPPFRSFLAFDYFSECWTNANRTLHGLLQADAQLPSDEAVGLLAFRWIAAGNALVSARPPLVPIDWADQDNRQAEWMALFDQADWLASVWARQPDQNAQVKSWLQNVAILMCPESGIATEASAEFFSPRLTHLNSFLQVPDTAAGIRRIRASIGAEFELGGLSELTTALISPECRKDRVIKLIEKMRPLVLALLSEVGAPDVEKFLQDHSVPATKRDQVTKVINSIQSVKLFAKTDASKLESAVEFFSRFEAGQPLLDPLRRTIRIVRAESADKAPSNRFHKHCLCPSLDEIRARKADLKATAKWKPAADLLDQSSHVGSTASWTD